MLGRWKSPTLTASGSPSASRATSFSVHGPTPTTARSHRWASSIGSVDGRLEPVGQGADPAERLGPPPLEPERVVGVVGERGQPLGRRLEPQPERSRRRLAVGPDERPVDPACLLAGDLLLEDRRDERLDDPVRARDPDPGEAPGELDDDPVRGLERKERGRVVVEPAQVGGAVDRPAGTRTPGADDELASCVDDLHRGRAIRCPGRPSGAAGLQAGSSGRRGRGGAATASGRARRAPGRGRRVSRSGAPPGVASAPTRSPAEPTVIAPAPTRPAPARRPRT